jgi:hypothetical protein
MQHNGHLFFGQYAKNNSASNEGIRRNGGSTGFNLFKEHTFLFC